MKKFKLVTKYEAELEQDRIVRSSIKVDQDFSVIQIARQVSPPYWEDLFQFADPELELVSSLLENKIYCPLKKDLFSAFWLTPLNRVKVVILGQDPYHQIVNGTCRAKGLSFSVSKDDDIPISLQNIFKEIRNNDETFEMPDNGDLTSWAKQGILLLNTCLTVAPNQPDSHHDIWLGFISKTLKKISEVNPYCIYLLWGKKAQSFRSKIGSKSVVFESGHPSGFSAVKYFFGNNHFNLTNEELVKQGKRPINWQI